MTTAYLNNQSHSPADAFSFGGGVQSTAALVLAAKGEIDYTTFAMADVGADSENPETVEYVENVSKPYAEAHGLRFELIHRKWRSGKYRSLLTYIKEMERSVPIPIHLEGGGPSNRLCTIRFKIEPIGRWQKDQGATPEHQARCGLGISMDEIERMRSESQFPYQSLDYPLINLRITRAECRQIVADAGLPPAPKSSCWFCPFQTLDPWRRMKRQDPERFTQAVELERMLIDRRVEVLGKDPGYLTRVKVPLDRAVDDQLSMFDEDGPESCVGSCWT